MLDQVVVVPVVIADIELAVGTFRHLTNTGYARSLPLIISADLGITEHDLWKLQRAATTAFKDVQIVQPPFTPKGKVSIPNWMLSCAIIRLIKHVERPMVVLPPGFMVVNANWVDLIQNGYADPSAGNYPALKTVNEWLELVSSEAHWFTGAYAKGSQRVQSGVEASGESIGVIHGVDVTKRLLELAALKPARSSKKLITIRRWAAIGDVVASTSVAKRLVEIGYRVNMVSFPLCAEAIRHSPYVEQVLPDGAPADVDLDQTYEKHLHRSTTHIHDLFYEAFNAHLPSVGLGSPVNAAPVLAVTPLEMERGFGPMERYPKPWTVICPKSHMAARSVPSDVIAGLAGKVTGTMFWTGPSPGPAGLVDLQINSIRQLMGHIAQADLVVSVDSGPLHLAAGLRKPTIAIRQSFDPDLRVSDQRDVTSFQKDGLPCLPCGQYMCRLEKDHPPCGLLDSTKLAKAINDKLAGIFAETVSAIIPVYKPSIGRLNKCLSAIVPQVDEVIVAIDGNGVMPVAVMTHPKIKVVSHYSKVRRGYGKTCNLGSRESTGRYLLMLNDDCFANAGMVGAMQREMINPKVAAVGGLLKYPDGRIQHGGTYRGEGNFGHLDHGKVSHTIRQPVDMEFVTFASALLRRTAYFSVDGFDERYDCYAEDSDACLRLRKAGWKVRYSPQATAIHEESQTTRSVMKDSMLHKGNVLLESIWGSYFKHNLGQKEATFPA